MEAIVAQQLQTDLRFVMEAVPIGVSLHSVDGRIQDFNSRLIEIHGAAKSDIAGLNCNDVFHLEPLRCPHETAIANKQSAVVECLSTNGEAHLITVKPIIADTGEIEGYVRLVQDITEVRQTQQALLRAERFATLGQMISGIAHDVGTPLSIISGYAEYLLMRTSPGAAGHKELSTILNQTRRIADFIRQLLELARPSQGRNDAIGMKGFLDELVELMGHHLRRAGVTARLICSTHPPLLYGDAPRLRQALFNILMNASHHAGNGGKIDILLNQNENTDEVQLSIRAACSMGRVQDLAAPFSSLMGTAGDGGSGVLGLSLTREILAEFRAIVTSAAFDGGSEIVIRLPVTRTEA